MKNEDGKLIVEAKTEDLKKRKVIILLLIYRNKCNFAKNFKTGYSINSIK